MKKEKQIKKDFYKLYIWLLEKNISFPIKKYFDINSQEYIKNIGKINQPYDFLYKGQICTIYLSKDLSKNFYKDMKEEIKTRIDILENNRS